MIVAALYFLADLLRALSMLAMNLSHAVRYQGNRMHLKSTSRRYQP